MKIHDWLKVLADTRSYLRFSFIWSGIPPRAQTACQTIHTHTKMIYIIFLIIFIFISLLLFLNIYFWNTHRHWCDRGLAEKTFCFLELPVPPISLAVGIPKAEESWCWPEHLSDLYIVKPHEVSSHSLLIGQISVPSSNDVSVHLSVLQVTAFKCIDLSF